MDAYEEFISVYIVFGGAVSGKSIDTLLILPQAEKGYACQVMEPVLSENAFLDGYRTGTTTDIPYFAHVRTEGTGSSS